MVLQRIGLVASDGANLAAGGVMRFSPLIIAAALLFTGAAVLHSAPQAATPSPLASADARLRTALRDAVPAEQPAPDPGRQNANLVAADAAIDAMAEIPADDRAGLRVKASALLLVDQFEVQDGWRLARSFARDEVRLDAAAMPSSLSQGP